MQTSRQNKALPPDLEPTLQPQGSEQPATGGQGDPSFAAGENSPTDLRDGPHLHSDGAARQADTGSHPSSAENAVKLLRAPVKTGQRVVRINENDLSQHLMRLRSVVQRIVAEDDVEDVLQDVMVMALNKLSTFRGEAAVGTWLYRIAVNAALAHRRRRSQVAKREEHWEDEETFLFQPLRRPRRAGTLPPDKESERKELSGLLQDAIAKLPPKYRDVYVLADVEEWSNEAIARALNLKVPAVKSRLFRARKMMRDQLAPHWESESTGPEKKEI
jgi:RNA polymerase sigma-70 factor (ECF subfamily)